MNSALALMILRGFLILVPSFLLLPEIIGVRGIWLAMPVSEAITFVFSVILLARINEKSRHSDR